MADKSFIRINGKLYNLDMLVEVEEYGPQGTGGYVLEFVHGDGVAFEVPKQEPGSAGKERYDLLAATATAIRKYLYDRTIQVIPGPYRRDEGDY